MRKSSFFYLGCLLLVVILTPFNSDADTHIKVGVYENRPLFFTDADGEVKGIFADILNYAAKKEGWTIEYVVKSWTECYEDLRSGKLDILGAIAFSDRRNQIFDFTYENVLSNWGQIYINGQSGIKSILDLDGKKIAVLHNDIYFNELKELIKQFGIESRFFEAFEYDTVLELVEAGKCDAGLVNYLYGHQNEHKYYIDRTSIILSPQRIGFAALKYHNREIINTLDLHLRKLKNNKKSIYYQSVNKWLGVDAVHTDPVWLIGICAAAVCLVLIFLILNTILRRQVRKRTRELHAKNQSLVFEIERRKSVEQALQKNEREYRSVFENTGTATFIIEGDMTISKVNSKVEDMTGYTKADIEGRMKTTDLVSPKDLRRITDYHYARRKTRGEYPSEYILDLVDNQGSTKKAFIQISVIPGTQKSIASLIDITSRVEAEEALRRNEEKYRSIIENIEEGYFELDLKGNLTFFNNSLCKITGFSPDELNGLSYKAYSNPQMSKNMFNVFNQIFTSKQPAMVADFDIIAKDKKAIRIDLSAGPLTDENDRVIGFRGLMRDVSERKKAELARRKLEKKLQQAQKMKAIGTLAGGVAHDLNNILSGIVSYPDLILMDLPNNSPLIEPIRTIRESGKKAAAIVQDLLTLARRGVSVSEVVNLNELIYDYLNSPQFEKLKSYHPNVTVESHLDSALLNLSGSPVHLSKTVMNLISNAAEAMPEGGTIAIKTKNKYIDLPVSGYDDVEEGDYAVLTVSDTGIGIAPEEVNQIFEPFYTKKVMGRSGTGLGMAVVWGTVKDHKGYIHIESDEGTGTTIELYFPVTRKPVRSNDVSLPLDNYQGQGQTILVVDDVKEQREIAAKILTQLGYSVDTVSSGMEAYEYLASNSADLIVLDMIMPPGIDGLETFQKIISKYPHQRAIIASGFSETERVRKAQRLGAGRYVKKPYTIEKIGLAVKSELEKNKQAA
ncbi:MAG: PAS domain S-box protein [Desulfobacterales bacterium]|jgi:PAS domain S-box-containing protein